jgi:phage terminase large subunit-like protein
MALDLTSLLGPLVKPTEDPDPYYEDDHVTILLDDIVAERCKRSLYYYVQRQWEHSPKAGTQLELGPSIEAICLHIQGQVEDALAKRINPSVVLRAQNLLINCPPRSLKTILLCFANAWAWTKAPWLQILYLSSTPSVVLDSARLFRDIVAGEWYQRTFVRGAWAFRADQDALSSLGNTAGGARRSHGTDANLTGKDSDWTILDDAHQMDDSADRLAVAVNNYDVNISSRINNPSWGFRTAIMQRAAVGDFSEHVLSQGWFHLRMPMEFETRPECRCPQCRNQHEPNAFGWKDWRTTEGEVLHPRFTPEYLADRLLTLRPHGYAGQMQQRPGVRGGNQFKVEGWRYFRIDGDELPVHPRPDGAHTGNAFTLTRNAQTQRLDVDWVCVSVDATGGSLRADASALGIVALAGKAERRFILRDLTRGPRSWLQTIQDIPAALVATANQTEWHDRITVLIEKKALGQGAIEQLEKAIADGDLTDIRGRKIKAKVVPYEPTGKGDKSKRAEFLEPLMDAGCLYLHEGASWLTKPLEPNALTSIVDEFAAFPKGSRDDRVDCVAQALDYHTAKKAGWQELFKTEQTPGVSSSRVAPAHTHTWVDGRCITCKQEA